MITLNDKYVPSVFEYNKRTRAYKSNTKPNEQMNDIPSGPSVSPNFALRLKTKRGRNDSNIDICCQSYASNAVCEITNKNNGIGEHR